MNQRHFSLLRIWYNYMFKPIQRPSVCIIGLMRNRWFRKLNRTLGSGGPIMQFRQGYGHGVNRSTTSQNMLYGMYVRFKFRTNTDARPLPCRKYKKSALYNK